MDQWRSPPELRHQVGLVPVVLATGGTTNDSTSWPVLVLAPVLLLVGGLIGSYITRRNAVDHAERAKREEVGRTIRWAAEQAVSHDERVRQLGVDALLAYADSDVLDDEDRRFLESVTDSVLAPTWGRSRSLRTSTLMAWSSRWILRRREVLTMARRIVSVTPSVKAAASLKVKLTERRGGTPSKAVRKIASAQPSRPLNA